MPAVRDLIVRKLRDAGVHTMFGVPGGGGNLDLIEAAGHAGLPFVLTATETGGAIAAIAQSDVTGRAGACLTTLGPGASSVANGVACAYLDRAPIVVFTDSLATIAAAAFEHQRFDHLAFFKPITKWTGRLTPSCSATTIEQAFEVLRQDPPGPVHIDCPEGFNTEVSPLPGRTAFTEAPEDSDRPDSSTLDALLSAARRPLVIAGLGARRQEDTLAIRKLIEQHHIPAMVTYKAKGVVPDDHPCFAGVFTNATIEQPIAGSSDLLIGVGLDAVELLPRQWPYSIPVVSCARWTMSDRHVPFSAQAVGDIALMLQHAGDVMKPSRWDLDDVREQVTKQRRAIDIPANHGMSAQQVVRAAVARCGSTPRVTVDAGAHMFAATMLWPSTAPGDMLISNGLSTMGFALPAAIGAALVDRDRRVVALTGDGGLLMCAGELLTAVREKLRIVCLVFSDESLSLIEIKQQRRQLRPSGVALGAVDWGALAESFGAAAFVASTEQEVADAVDQSMTIDGPVLIEAKIDRSNYAATLAALRG